MPTSVELREQSRRFAEAAQRETSAHAAHMMADHAAALEHRAEMIERGLIQSRPSRERGSCG